MKYPRFTLIIYNKAKKQVHTYYSRRKNSVLPRLNLYFKRGFSVYIKVIYKPTYKNEGNYFTKKDAIHAWRCFTEKSLVKEFL